MNNYLSGFHLGLARAKKPWLAECCIGPAGSAVSLEIPVYITGFGRELGAGLAVNFSDMATLGR